MPEPLALRILRNRTLVRAPILLYRAGLGFLLGSRMLMLEHTGRVSGAAREVVLEVTDRPGPGRYVVVSGFGERAQWYRNVLARPAVRVSVGRRRSVPATATPLPREQAAALFAAYPRRHPRSLEPARTGHPRCLRPGSRRAARRPRPGGGARARRPAVIGRSAVRTGQICPSALPNR